MVLSSTDSRRKVTVKEIYWYNKVHRIIWYFKNQLGVVKEDCEGTNVLVRVIWSRFTVDNTICFQTKDGIAEGDDADVSTGYLRLLNARMV